MKKRRTFNQIAIVDKEELFREGIKNIFESEDTIQIIQECNSLDELQLYNENNLPNIILIELGTTPLTTLQSIANTLQLNPKLKFLILTDITDNFYVEESLKLGAVGYLLKRTNVQTIKEAILHIGNGGYYLDPKVTHFIVKDYQLLNKLKQEKAFDSKNSYTPCLLLTNRECDILQLITDGNSNAEMATILSISDKTINNHLSNILKKLEVTNRTAAVVKAIKNNWVIIK